LNLHDIVLHLIHELSAIVDRQAGSRSSQEPIKGHSGALRGDVPKRHINAAKNGNGKEHKVAVQPPQLLIDDFSVIDVPTYYDRTDHVMQIASWHTYTVLGEGSRNPFEPIFVCDFQDYDPSTIGEAVPLGVIVDRAIALFLT
jgi:hypothetical protein